MTGTTSGGRRRDGGSASVWVLSCVVLLLLVTAVARVRALAVLARHRAESAADLAALAAAGRIGVDDRYCAVAAEVARGNGTQLALCRPDVAGDGRAGTVVVSVRLPVSLPLVGDRTVTATARAGRLPAGVTPRETARRAALWHAGFAGPGGVTNCTTRAPTAQQCPERRLIGGARGALGLTAVGRRIPRRRGTR